MTTRTALVIMSTLSLLLIGAHMGNPFAVVGMTGLYMAILLTWWRRQEAAWVRRAEAESRAVLDRIARGEERTYTLAEVRETLRREREGPTS